MRTLSLNQHCFTSFVVATLLCFAGITFNSAEASNLSANAFSYQASSLLTDSLCNVTAQVQAMDANCFDECSGIAAVIATGGDGSYSFFWFDGDGDTLSTQNIVLNLCPGDYVVIVVDDSLCRDTGFVVVGEPAPLVVTYDHTDPKCFGSSDGSIAVSISGGTAPYTATASFKQTTKTYNVPVSNQLKSSTLPADNYVITITDDNGCSQTDTIKLINPTPIMDSVVVQDASCFGANDGFCQLFLSGGTPPYVFQVNGGPVMNYNPPVYSHSVAPGTYVINYADANMCMGTVTVTISEPPPINLKVNITSDYNGKDISCAGATDGSAAATASGGTAPYSYSWSGGQTTTSITGLGAGTYSVTVTDANSCTQVGSVTLVPPTPLNVSVSNDTLDCYGDSDGSISATVSGGTPDYGYAWDANAGSQTGIKAGNLTAGSYSITVTDKNGCTASSTGNVLQPDSLNLSFSITNISCFASPTGAVDLTVNGGTGPYSYLWSNGDTSQDISNLTAGNYTVTVTDANGCTKIKTAKIEQNDNLVLTDSIVDILCHGDSTGEIYITVTGGKPAFTYNWSNGANTSSITGLAAGSYSVTVMDGNQCSATMTYTVNQPPTPVSASAVVKSAYLDTASGITYDVSSSTATDGIATASGSGGTGTYTYMWSNGQTTAQATGLAAGMYLVTVTDANNCSDTAKVTLIPPPDIRIPCDSVFATDVTCVGGSDGKATAYPTGGIPPYSYLWSDGQMTQTAVGLSAGTYSVTVTDVNQNIDICNSVIIGEPIPLQLFAKQTPASCEGICNGIIVSSTLGGTPPFSFLYSNGSTNSVATGLCAGPYSVTVTDANGCTASKNVTVTAPDSIELTETHVDVSCNGGSDGSVNLTVLGGGTPPYLYNWTNNATTEDISGLSAGFYSVTVSDTNGCIAKLTVEIEEPAPLSLLTSTVNPFCVGSSNGAATVTASGGTDPYTYQWDANASNQTTATAVGLSAGSYSVTVTDANGCTASTSVTLVDPAPIIISINTVNVSCKGLIDGTATVKATGTLPPVTYMWSDGQSTETADSLAAGTYGVTITDDKGCTATGTVTITEPDSLIAIANCTPVSCFGGRDGTASSSITGGTQPYVLTWYSTVMHIDTIPPDTFPAGNGLRPGIFYGFVVDANGCVDTLECTITEPDELIVSATSTPTMCFGSSDGSATASAIGGTTPYTYLWNAAAANQMTATATGLAAGTYTVVVTDSNSCSDTTTVVVVEPTQIMLTTTQTNVSCSGFIDGTATVIATGGTPGYTYLWDDKANNQTTSTATGLAADNYVVVVTDANGCTASATVLILEPLPLSASATGTDVSCNGGSDGTASVTAGGGTTPYSYLWSDGSTTTSISGLTAGSYTITVTDANGCIAVDSVELTEPDAITLLVIPTPVSCNGGNDGSAIASATGGTPGYSYQWDANAGNQTTAVAIGLSANTYGVTVTDMNGCTASETTIIIEPTAIVLIPSKTDVSCNGGNDGAASVSASGGTPGYSYQWDANTGGQTTSTAVGLSAGTYSVTVTDNNSCTATISIPVNEPLPISLTPSSTPVSCNGGSDGSASVSAADGTPGYAYQWDALAGGQTTSTAVGLSAGSYSVTVTDANGCTASTSATVIEPTLLTVGVNGTNITCNGGSDGSATASAAGGTMPYSYKWSNGSTTATITGLSAGTYVVTATDLNGCEAVDSITISEPPAIQLFAKSNPSNCSGSCDGRVISSTIGGTPPFTFVWSTGDSTSVVTGLCPGGYTVTATDAKGCTATASTTVLTPDSLNISETHVNVLCNGDSTGSIDVTVTGGTPPYSYLWSNGSTMEDLSGLTAGTYTVSVTDTNSCVTTLTIIITEPDAITLTPSATDVSCNGGSDGTASVFASGGTPAYSYAWDANAGSQTTATAIGLTAGTYGVTVTDANGCTASTSATVNEPALLTLQTSQMNVSCNGGSDGSASVSASGGTTPYSYAWSNGMTTSGISGLTANTYSVTVTDENGCVDSASVTITEPDAITVIVIPTPVSCNGGNDGSAIASASGGTPGYSYQWDANAANQTTAVATGLSANTYGVTVTDMNGCTASKTTTITEPSAIVLTPAKTDVSCFGGNDGTASVSASGGTPSYTYKWDANAGGQITSTAIGLSAGTYSVTVTDANGCTASTSVTVDEPAMIVLTTNQTNVSCNGLTDGTGTVNASGGTPGYTYLWDDKTGNQTTSTATGLGADLYSVVVTDANGCPIDTTVTITEPAVLTAAASGTNISCNGGDDGTASVSAGGGTTPYSYLWSEGSTTTSISGLTAGTYVVTVTDANGCIAVDSVELSEPDAISLLVIPTPVSCNGGNDGSAIASASGGTPGYSYQWDANAANQTTAVATGLSANTYGVTVTDMNGCTASKTTTITEPSAIVLTPAKTDVSCFGGNDGTASVSASGGTPGYTYKWDANAGGQITSTAVGLSAGTYSVTVTDANGCTASTSVTVDEPAMIVLTTNQTNVSCNGLTDGTGTVNASGGTPGYTYLWDDKTGNQTTSTATGLGADLYSVVVTDANGCTSTTTVTITEPDVLAVFTNKTDVSCFGFNNGSIMLSVSGGTTPYSYNWSNGSTMKDQIDLIAGTYTVTVSDDNSCADTLTIIITQPDTLEITGTSTDITCFGFDNGSISVSVSGGTLSYSYSWSNGDTIEDLSGLSAGTYTLLVTDQNECTATATYTINEPDTLVASGVPTNLTCNGSQDGSIDLTVSGGVAPYSYSWSNGDTTQDLDSIPMGIYTVTVTDVNQCTATVMFFISEPAPVVVSVTGTNLSCNGGSDGTATASAIGGTMPYSYKWSNGLTTATITGLTAGSYNVTVTDVNGCSGTGSRTLSQPPAIQLFAKSNSSNCAGSCDGRVIASAIGGTPPFTFVWSNGATGTVVDSICPGGYSVTATDANGCTATASTTVLTPDSLNISETHVNVLCNGDSTGSIDVTVTGGTPPYSYLWSNGSTMEDLSGLTAGTYTVSVTDTNSCVTTLTIIITEPDAITLTPSATDVSCNGGSDGTASVFASGGTPAYSYAWDANAGSQTTATAIGLTAGTYGVTVTDANGCTASTSATVNEPALLTLQTSQMNVSCNGGSDGSASVSASGGTTPYSYAWSNGMTTSGISGLTANTYSVTVTDENGCVDSASVTITEPDAITVIVIPTPVSCNGGNDGSAIASASGGTPGYSYQWDANAANQTTAVATGLSANTYGVTVTDMNGCTASKTTTITEPSAIVLTPAKTDVSCFGGNDGTASVSASGGTPGYTYKWDSNAGGQITSTAVGLSAGTYSVTVTDANGCTASTSVTVDEPAMIVLTTNQTNVSCNGLTDGTGTVNASGGTPGYTYLWDDKTGNQTTSTATGLGADLYSVVVTDANGCPIDTTVTITEPAVLTAAASGTNISCNGGDDGTASVSAGGGTTPYSYLWSEGSTTTSISGLTAGTYVVTVTDANGCIAVDSVELSEPDAISLLVIPTPVSCNGGNDGSAIASASGGTPGYSYQWDANAANQTTAVATGLSANTYGVTVTDMNGCTASKTTTITEPSAIVLTPAKTDVSCFGGNDGTASVSASGGTPGYTYLWDANAGGQITSTAVGLSAGTYSVTVTDANGCTASTNVTIDEPTIVVASTTPQDATCYGFSDGSATASGSGGTQGYTYLWDDKTGNQTTSTATGLSADVYTVVVTDANGCTASSTVTIGEPTLLTVVALGTDISCNGGDDGTASASAAGGTSPYSYSWSNGATGSMVTGLKAGTYYVTATDDNNCIAIDSVTLAQPDSIELFAKSNPASCYGLCDGRLIATTLGGTPPITFAWSNNASGNVVKNVCPGTYTVTATDANGCTQVSSTTVDSPDSLLLSATKVNIACSGDSSGSIDLTVSGGTAPYTYLWSNGATTEDISSLTAGTYTVTVTDDNDCDATLSMTILEQLLLSVSASATDASCKDGNDGTATALANGGMAPYSYLWDANAASQTTMTATGLAAGTYSVTVTDKNACVGSASATVDEPTAIALIISSTDVSCNGGSDGTAGVTASGGTPPYSYSWSNNATQSSISGLTAGTYNVTVTDDNGCTAVDSTVVEEPTMLMLIINGMDVSCNGGNDGTASVLASGGTAPYSYDWSNGMMTSSISGLTADAYSVTVTDANNCTAVDSITIDEPVALTLIKSKTNVSCNGGSDGIATVSASGGTMPYSYLWDATAGSQTTATAIGLSQGTYGVTVTDDNGCIASTTVTIEEPKMIVLTLNSNPVSCNGGNDGAAGVSISGGTAPYTFLWNTGDTTAILTGLQLGTYTVTVTDANGCIASDSVDVIEASPVMLQLSGVNISCNGGSNGSATAVASGGTPSYTYKWSNNMTSATISNLTAGTYAVTATDANGCIAVDSIELTEPAILQLFAKATDATCEGVCDGIVLASTLGGTGTVSFAWSNGATGMVNDSLCPNTYTVTATDANGCTAVASATVKTPDSVSIALTGGPSGITNVSCNAGSDGAIDITASGGSAPYTYAWSNGATTEDISGLTAGFYTVVVTDTNGCNGTATYEITEPDSIVVLISAVDPTCDAFDDGSATASASGGTAPYSYAWSNGGTTASISNLMVGSYTVTATDANGCTGTESVTLTADPCGSIGDYVWCDDNGDGIQDANEAPIAGVVIELIDMQGNVIATDTTDANGLYLFADLFAGKYIVNVQDATVPAGKVLTTNNDPDTVMLDDGENIDTIDFGYRYTGSIGDYVWCDDNGDGIQDANEAPIAGVVIELLDAQGNVIATDTTDANGLYLFDFLPPATYTVNVVDATVPVGKVLTTNNDPTTVNLGPGENRLDVDFGYRYTGSIGDYVWCDDNGDGIQDANEAPIAGVVIELLDAQGNVIATDTTDANGLYLFDFLPPATYTVNVVDATVPAGKVLTTNNDPTTVNLGPGENRLDVDFGYRYTGSIGDYVWCDDNGDGIQDANEAPIAGVVIELLDAQGNVIATDTTDANGLYLFDFLPPATYTVNVVDATVPVGKDLTTNNDPTTVNLGPGENRLDVDFGYRYTGSIGDYVWCDDNLDGIQDPTEAPIAGVIIELLDAQGNVIATDTTDANGLYLFDFLPPATYTVNVVDATTPAGKDLTTNNDPTTVNLGPGENRLDVDFGYGCVKPTLSAVVTDVSCFGGNDGAIDLTVSGGSGPSFTYSWSNGATTEDISGLTAGIYSVTVTATGGCSVSASFTVNEPAPLTVTTQLTVDGCSETMISCPPLQLSQNCDCDGKMKQVTVVYSGSSSTVTVKDGGNNPIIVFTNVSTGDTLVASSSSAGMSTFDSKTFWNDGGSDIEIHTSCSQDILNQSFGPFFVTGYIDGAGNSCGGSNPFSSIALYDNGCPCESKMIEVSFIYNPQGSPNTTIEVYNKSGDLKKTISSVQPGDLITVTAADIGDTDLDSKIFVSVNGSGLGEIHTSCSQEIIGMTVNDVLIVGYVDGDGVTCDATECTPSFITPSATCECSGGMREVTVIYQGSSSTVYVKDGSSTLLTFNNVSTGDTLVATASDAGLNKWPSGMDWKDGSGTVEIHTSCSDDIVGQTYGNYLAIGFVDDDGNICGPGNPFANVMILDLECECSGKMTEVSIIYNPQGAANSTVDVYDDGNNLILSFTGVQPGDLIEIKASDAALTDLDTKIFVSTNGGPQFEIHTSCSQDILGLIAGDVVVVGYVDGDGIACAGQVIMTCPSYTIQATAAGGTAPYTYSWSDGSTGTTISDTTCSSTSFSVTVTDANGCIVSDTVDIDIDAPIVATFTKTDVSCNGSSDGSATVTPSGGVAPYSYIWSNGATSASISNLAAGNYTVTISDANGCEGVATVCIKEASSLMIQITSTNASCGVCDGSASALASGGDSTSYQYSWSSGANTADISGLCAGTYGVTVTDANGCSATASVTISGVSDLIVTTTTVDDGCNSTKRVCEVVNITSNSRVFWLPGFLNPTKYYAADNTTGLTLEEYADGSAHFYGRVVNIGDSANGFDVNLWFKDKKDYSAWIASGGQVKTFDPANDPTTWDFYVFDNNKPNTLTGFGALSGELVTLTDKAGMNYGIQIGYGANDKTFTYGISTWFDYTGTSSGGGDINADLTNCVNVPNGSTCNGSATVSATGGSGSYSYLWSDGQTTATASGLCGGTYSVIVNDTAGCIDSAVVTIGSADSLSVSGITTNVSCDTATVCNSMTILEWDMEACAAGSKYSEFYATKVLASAFDKLIPTNLYRNSGNHSCTPGVNNGTGMCVGTDSKCTFDDNDPYALRFNVTLGPKAGESASLTGFTFYEKAPSTYVWTSGGSGINDYPTKYGIRVLKDGVEIFKQTDIATSQNWALQSFDFSSIPGFTVSSGSSVFSFELRAYCRIGNSATQSVWDLDNFAIQGCNSTPAGRSCDGAIALNVSGGSGSYTYNWLDAGSGGSASISKQISAANNDAEEYPANGNTSTAGLYHSMGTETIGLRFDKLQIPDNAIITSAHIEFTSSSDKTGSANLTIVGEDADNSSVFDGTHQDISSRTTTTSNAPWNNPVAWYAHKQYNSPDVSSIVQEIVDRNGWVSGNPITLIISGTGEREAKSYDNYPAKAPKLIVSYTVPSGNFNGPNASDLCAGTYCVIVTDDLTGCSSNVCITVGEDTCGSAKSSMRMAQGSDASDLKVAAYPNPTRGLLNVAIESTTNASTTVKVYDLIGNEVYSRTVSSDRYNQIQVDLSRLSVGMYMLEVESDGQRVTKQLILSTN